MLRRVAVLLVLTVSLGSARLLACELACVDGRTTAQAGSCHDESDGTTVATPQAAHCIADQPGARTAIKPGLASFLDRPALSPALEQPLPHATVGAGASAGVFARPERSPRQSPAVLRI